MRLNSLALIVCFLVTGSAKAQDSYKVETIEKAAPASLSPEIRGSLDKKGYKILDASGKPFGEIWLRKEIPASTKPAGPKGPIQYPFLADGEILGALEFLAEGHDYRDQPIAKGTYVMRYGLQPVNGDHLGVSVFRDYTLLLPASKDRELKRPARKALEERSAEAAGTSHPAVFLLVTPSAGDAKAAPKMVQDNEKNLWSVVVPLDLKPQGEAAGVVLPVQIVVAGVAPA